MKYILKSGRGFVKREKDIIMDPACKGGEKVIHSPCIKELWEEMKYLDKNFSYNNIDIYNLLKENSLVFEINEDEWDDYQRLSRNIQFLSLHNDIEKQIDILEKYKKVIITEAVTKGFNSNVEMKNSGVEWIKEIPKNWKVNKIKYLFTSGKGLSITKENLIDDGLPVISYGQIHAKNNNSVDINKDLLRFVSYGYQKYNFNCNVKKNDFIFADTSEDKDGCGNFVYKRDDSLLFAGYHSIILHSKIQQDNRYLAYLFLTDLWRKQLRETASGVKVFSITQKNLINSSIILPPSDEQIEIANVLDKKCYEIIKAINEKREQLIILDNYKKSLIYEYVTGKKEVE